MSQGASVAGGQMSLGGKCPWGACVARGQVSLRGQVSQGASVSGANVAQSSEALQSTLESTLDLYEAVLSKKFKTKKL